MTSGLTGLVLAGGASARMGADKALIELDGRRLLDIVVDTLAGVCDTVLVAGGSRSLPETGPQLIGDAEGDGPLAGIVAGLRAAKTPLLAVVAVDMPLASGAVLQRLAAAWSGEPAVAPRAGGSIQPLHAIYATDAAEEFAALLAGGEQSPRAAIEVLGGRVVDPSDYDPDGAAGAFWTNVNSPADLRRLTGRSAAG